MEGSDDFFNNDIWSPSLRDELFADYSLGSSWNNDANANPFDDSAFPTLSFPAPNAPQDHPNSLQQQRGNNTNSLPTFDFQNSPPRERKPSQFDLPNFPLATDPRGGPSSNSSGRPPPILSTHHTQPRVLTPPSAPDLAHDPPPPSFSSFSSAPDTPLTNSERSDTPWPDSDQDNLNHFVDLTQESSPPSMPPMRHSTPSRNHSTQPSQRRIILRGPNPQYRSETPPNPAKRRKTGMEASQSSQRSTKIEEVDLIDVDDDKGLSKVLEQQRLATIKAQQDQANKPVKLSTLQCIICMESMKDLTTTSCGHLFCHSCLMEALIAGENQGSEVGKGTPKCPVCRKKVIRPLPTDKRDMHHIVPLSMKLRTKSKVSKDNRSGKGKERAVS